MKKRKAVDIEKEGKIKVSQNICLSICNCVNIFNSWLDSFWKTSNFGFKLKIGNDKTQTNLWIIDYNKNLQKWKIRNS